MSGTLNELLDTTALENEMGRICPGCKVDIKSFEDIRRTSDGNIWHSGCFWDEWQDSEDI